MKFETLQTIADTIARGEIEKIPALVADILKTETGAHWRRDLTKLARVAETGAPAFTVIAKGNGKLPFLAFSSLPGRGFCPGAGDCLKFCYSFRAWRYPAAFSRQAQNSILMQTETGRAAIVSALDNAARKIKGGRVDFRLYVDGDFASVSEIDFWFSTLAARGRIAAYGYSKSWSEFLQYAETGGKFPANYLLNLSSGSVHGDAVNIGRKVQSSDHGTREHNRELRAAYGAKAFTCPGKCGDCTKGGHACGLDTFRNIPVIIAVH
jgi:hypothetical protein